MSNIIDSIRLSGVTYTIQDSGGIPESTFTAYTAATDSRIEEDEKVTAAGLNALNTNKLDASAYTPTDLSQYWTSAQTNSAITQAVSGISGNNVVELTQAQYDDLVTGGTVDPTALYIITDAAPQVITVTSAVTSGSSEVVTSGGVYNQVGGLKLVKLTQAEYDALDPNYDSDTLYVIVN